jgi:PEP-CTERM motif
LFCFGIHLALGETRSICAQRKEDKDMKITHLRKFGGALGGLLFLSGLAATPAQAVLITQFDYLVNSGFLTYAPAGPAPKVVGDMPGTLGGLPTRLRWGDPTVSTTDPIDPNLQSKLSVQDPIVGPVPALITNGAYVPGAELTHDNFPIFYFQGNALMSATLATQLTLAPLLPNPPYDGSVSIGPIGPALFDILFKETLNNDPGCVNGDSPNCSDIFVLLNPENLTVPLGHLGGDEWFYTALLKLDNLVPLSNAQCAAAGAAAGCVGLITAENATNNFGAQFAIEASVPEPGTLALLGLVFAGMGLIRRRHARPGALSR